MSKDRFIEIIPEIKDRLFYFDTIDSTNNYAKELARQGHRDSIVISGSQSAGKGRLGRSFTSPKDCGLYLSMLLPSPARFAIPATVLIGGCVSRALEGILSRRVEVKWVNDVILDFCKVGGILAEADSDAIIMGIGINVNTPQECFDSSMPHVSSLAIREGRQFSIPEVAAAIIGQVDQMTARLDDSAYLGDLLEHYRSRLVTLGREVKVCDSKGERIGRAVALLQDGSLEVDFGGNTEVLIFGDVSVRGIDRYI